MDQEKSASDQRPINKERLNGAADRPVKRLSVRELCEYCLSEGDLLLAGGSVSALWKARACINRCRGAI